MIGGGAKAEEDRGGRLRPLCPLFFVSPVLSAVKEVLSILCGSAPTPPPNVKAELRV